MWDTTLKICRNILTRCMAMLSLLALAVLYTPVVLFGFGYTPKTTFRERNREACQIFRELRGFIFCRRVYR